MRLVQKGLIEETANPFHRLPTIATSDEDHAAPMRELHNRMTVCCTMVLAQQPAADSPGQIRAFLRANLRCFD